MPTPTAEELKQINDALEVLTKLDNTVIQPLKRWLDPSIVTTSSAREDLDAIVKKYAELLS